MFHFTNTKPRPSNIPTLLFLNHFKNHFSKSLDFICSKNSNAGVGSVLAPASDEATIYFLEQNR